MQAINESERQELAQLRTENQDLQKLIERHREVDNPYHYHCHLSEKTNEDVHVVFESDNGTEIIRFPNKADDQGMGRRIAHLLNEAFRRGVEAAEES